MVTSWDVLPKAQQRGNTFIMVGAIQYCIVENSIGIHCTVLSVG